MKDIDLCKVGNGHCMNISEEFNMLTSVHNSTLLKDSEIPTMGLRYFFGLVEKVYFIHLFVT